MGQSAIPFLPYKYLFANTCISILQIDFILTNLALVPSDYNNNFTEVKKTKTKHM